MPEELFEAEVRQRYTNGTTGKPMPFRLPKSVEPYYNDAVAAGYSIVVGVCPDRSCLFSELWCGGKCRVTSLCNGNDGELRDKIAEALRLEPWLLPFKPEGAPDG